VSRFLSLFILCFLLLPQPAGATPPTLVGKVIWVYDGDTIKVENIGKVRLLGIDTPEKEDSERDRYYLKRGIHRERLRSIADEALQFLIKNTKGQHVTLHTDQEKRDRHGRLLAYVYLPDSRLINQMLLGEGLAAVYRKFEFRLKEDFLATESRARKKQIGLWQE
jgi:micrococcal nuclease